MINIRFSVTSYDVYDKIPYRADNQLPSPFSHLDRMVAERIEAQKIALPFREIELTIEPFSAKTEKDEQYITLFEGLPSYYRGKYMVRIVVPTEHDHFTLESIFGLIGRAFEVMISKKKKTDDYDPEAIRNLLNQLENELTTADLPALEKQYDALLRQEVIDRHRREREARRKVDVEKNRLVYDVRLYDYLTSDGKDLFPYNRRVAEKVYDKLRAKKFRLPGYSHMLVVVADSEDNALLRTNKVENWQGFGIAVYPDYKEFASKSEQAKQRIAFDLLSAGLYDMAALDKLDAIKLREALAEAEHDLFKK